MLGLSTAGSEAREQDQYEISVSIINSISVYPGFHWLFLWDETPVIKEYKIKIKWIKPT